MSDIFSEEPLAMMLAMATTEDSGLDRALASYLRQKGVDVEGIPRYTKSLNAALGFARAVAPNHSGAATWGRNGCKAAINDGRADKCATPAIAVCVAALQSVIVARRKPM